MPKMSSLTVQVERRKEARIIYIELKEDRHSCSHGDDSMMVCCRAGARVKEQLQDVFCGGRQMARGHGTNGSGMKRIVVLQSEFRELGRKLASRTSSVGISSLLPMLHGSEYKRKYRIGQLYTISKHSHEQSDKGEGVEVVKNEPHEDPVHGNGQFTEKRVHLSSKLPSWARAVVPRIFYITEKAWNYYPYTITEYTCSFLPKFSIYIETKYEDNNGCNDHIFDSDKNHTDHEVCFLDIAFDEIPDRYYKSTEDLRYFASVKTGRGPLKEGWRNDPSPVMCSYKQVTVKFEVWGLQTRVEQFVQKVIRDILLIGHRQAFAWVDEWCDMTMDEVRQYEKQTQEATNEKIGIMAPTISVSEAAQPPATRSAPASAPSTPLSGDPPDFLTVPKDRPRKKSAPEMLTLPELRERSSNK
ncbi:cytoplasmic phosphatidylinositol transfer protein 1 [Rhincodon typus]|uniref:cytoplasmic phosphatidylinositol transfer protein 1 n=1 Tax=Rhincodon typus TaxID=259920 RepID=UPI00202F01D7|nr:cytoplasmic phosphatidylinositol transfer protein 1 [Rhincodon typus]